MRSVFFFVFLFTFLSCSSELEKDIDYIILSGNIDSAIDDSLNLLNLKEEIIMRIALDSNNAFRDTLYQRQGYYSLEIGTETAELYLKPGFDLSISVNMETFTESLQFEGNGSSENNYLGHKSLVSNQTRDLITSWEIFTRSEVDFLEVTDSLYNLNYVDLIDRKSDLDTNFFFIESQELSIGRLYHIGDYEGFHLYLTNDQSFTVSEDFPDPFENIDLNDERLLVTKNYIHFIEMYLRKKVTIARDDSDSLDYTLTYAQQIEKDVTNQQVKEELFENIGLWHLTRTSELDAVFEIVEKHISDTVALHKIRGRYAHLKKTEKGNLSPDFFFSDINGNVFSLQDFSGKLVYIDIWATWCKPCVKEIPYLEHLVDSLKNEEIVFVSIAREDSRVNWEAMLTEKQMGGIQLFAEDKDASFFNDYVIEGIPRFILLDRSGRIIDNHAKRPSDPSLLVILEEYL